MEIRGRTQEGNGMGGGEAKKRKKPHNRLGGKEKKNVDMYVCMYVWSSHIAEYGSTG